MSWVRPDPTLAQPAATPLAWPTTEPENMELIQNWLETKFARENPIKNRTRMNDLGEEMKAVERTTGAVRRERVAVAIRGPTTSQVGPMARREKMEPAKEAMPAALTSVSVRPRSSRITGRRGGIEKVEKKQQKRESHARWKESMWGRDMESGRKTVAL